MLLVTLTMFALFSGYWACDVYLLWAEVYRYLPRPLEATSPNATYLDGLYIPWTVAYFAPQVFRFMMVMPKFRVFPDEHFHLSCQLTLGDTVSLWRAYVIWGRPRWLFRLFASLVIIDSGESIGALAMLLRATF